jgi:hypothetical protein
MTRKATAQDVDIMFRLAELCKTDYSQSSDFTVGRVTAGQVENVISQPKAAGVRLSR